MKDEKLSTSALARQLEVPVQQLFGTLKDYDWIRKVEDGWVLTPKGEFEGGEYKVSKRYGRYIVWPASLEQHPMLQALENSKMLSAAALGERFGLSGRAVNRALAELGWLQRDRHGWALTATGQAKGGVQLENRQTDMFYVLWPQVVVEDVVLTERLRECAVVVTPPPASAEGDLFSRQQNFEALDGHRFQCPARLAICHWLYMAGVVHACHRRLPVEEVLHADFYLPRERVFIDYWAADAAPAELRASMRKAEVYKAAGLSHIELHPEDIAQLDDVMPRQLHRLGVDFL